MQVTYDFSGKSALLIGGTTGIGRATALAFAKAGANVFVAGVGFAHGESLKKEIAALKTVDVEFREVDVRDAAAMADLHKRAFDRFGRIDVAFNNAGVPGKTAPVQELEEADFDLLVDVNLKGITPLLVGMFGSEQGAKDTVLPMIPMGRISDPSEIAQLVLFLSSDAASFITGQAVVIDRGGFVAGAGG
jgi:NAD(P)-dependent dehydrogenase (short-subunit alcohol dehydrogenase family)